MVLMPISKSVETIDKAVFFTKKSLTLFILLLKMVGRK